MGHDKLELPKLIASEDMSLHLTIPISEAMVHVFVKPAGETEGKEMNPELLELTESQFLHIEALFEIVVESTDANAVRRAIAGLMATPGGRNYLTAHPVAV